MAATTMNTTLRFQIGQGVYVTNTARDIAWPALVGDLVPPSYVQLIFNNNETALVAAENVAAWPEVTMENFEHRLVPMPEEFFQASHYNSAPTQFPNIELNELGEDPNDAQKRREAEECDDVPMLPITSTTTDSPPQAKIMQIPRKAMSRRERLSSKLTLRNRYHQRITPQAQSKRCCCVQ